VKIDAHQLVINHSLLFSKGVSADALFLIGGFDALTKLTPDNSDATRIADFDK
jgi:hypothetical protein